MNRIVSIVLALIVAPLFAVASPKEEAPPSSAPAAFEHLKSLVGEWRCVDQGMEEGGTSFRLVAHGSALVETLAPGPKDEMVNVYHPDGAAVVMTHYCGAGNQPRMRCAKDGDRLVFTMTDITNWKKGEPRMKGVTIVMTDADHMKQEWVSESDGKSETMTMEFVRKQ